ncbi:MAG: HDIG domain-containing protein [Candidatus Pacearchaeota archaeon]|nr:MAG: HDIG domain-containing protein [Candidatus Pacearchaeota archaeon]
MNKLPISRDEAWELVKKYNQHEQDLIHYLESEAVMRNLAKYLGLSEEEIEYWGILGLLHDIDWGITKENVETHLTKAPEILRNAGFDEKFIETILSHGYGFQELPHLKDKKRIEKIQHALAASETITGLIHAYALMRGKRVSDMEVSGLKKKFKDKTFAAKVDRDVILEIEKIGIPLDEFFKIAIEGIKNIKDKVGLI